MCVIMCELKQTIVRLMPITITDCKSSSSRINVLCQLLDGIIECVEQGTHTRTHVLRYLMQKKSTCCAHHKPHTMYHQTHAHCKVIARYHP